MESLKKVISLNQAAQISGYTQDYLGYLIRHKDIKGVKKGGTWFTTEEEIKNFLFKKKIRNNEFAVKDFFSPTRNRNIIILTIIIFTGVLLLLSYVNKNKINLTPEVQATITSDEGMVIK